MRLLRTTLTLLSLTCTPFLQAQFTAKTVVFTNAAPYSEADLRTLAALKPGDRFSKTDLEAAAARLMITGYFDEVLPVVDGPFKAVSVVFKLKPTPVLLPAGLENFVWFTPEELDAFRHSLPLLVFGVPEAGDQADRVQAALQQMLDAKSIPGKVTHDIVAPGTGRPQRVVEYRVEPAHVQLVIHFGGATPDMVPAVKAALALAQRSQFNEGLAGNTTNDILLTPYLDAGYVEAKLTKESRTSAAATEAAPKIDLTVTVVPGAPYKVASITFAGTPLVSAEAFAKTQRLHPGDIASRKLLYASLLPITQVYREAAYLDSLVDAAPVLDPATHTVAFTVVVSPGEQYRLKSITVQGLPEDIRPDFDRTFPIKFGDLYNETAVFKYLVSHPDIKALAPYTGTFKALADPATHLVELSIKFVTNSFNAR